MTKHRRPQRGKKRAAQRSARAMMLRKYNVIHRIGGESANTQNDGQPVRKVW